MKSYGVTIHINPRPQYFWRFVDKFYGVTIQDANQPLQQFFHMVLFIANEAT